MPKTIKLALAQINPTVGDIRGNTRLIIRQISRSWAGKADIVAFPELAVTGYPPEDLLLRREFIDKNIQAVQDIAKTAKNITAIVGFVDRDEHNPDRIYNAAAIIRNGKIIGVYRKMHLPNYGVFDEKRYFTQGQKPLVFKLANGFAFGVNICEDIWVDRGPTKIQSRTADLIINISASPFHLGKYIERQELVRRRARDNRVAIAYLNMAGGQDELIFDGRSMVFGPKGSMLARGASFRDDLVFVRIPDGQPVPMSPISDYLPEFEAYEALKLGIRDYIRKNGFSRAVVGLSGGVDSAIVYVLAIDALGKENVKGIFMPSRYTSKLSKLCVEKLVRCTCTGYTNIDIQPLYNAYVKSLRPRISGRGACIDLAQQNLQARIRGNILMALSNRYGCLVLTTGNKSELSTGYATLYGDMAGGLAVLKDVPKTLVYRLCHYRNRLTGRPVIPAEIIDRAPTAELKPNQKDSDTLPTYEILDPILKLYIEDNQDIKDISRKSGYDMKTVSRVITMVDRSEYKRRQSAPGIKITPRAFGKDRRFPIVNKFYLT
ncbi:MAG: NAD+ synthase [Candidatus Brocadiia bacterium]